MNHKIQFLMIELIAVTFLILLSAILLNSDHTGRAIREPVESWNTGSLDVSSEAEPTSSSGTSSEVSSGWSQLSDWRLVLANESHPLEAEWINSVKTKTLPNGLSVDERIYEPLTTMLNDAEALGYHLIVCSAYRSYDKQVELFNDRVQRYLDAGYTQKEAYEKGKTSVSLPGASEHHTGLAVDIVAEQYQNLDDGMLSRPEIKWLYANCQKYGFIVRYPNGKSDITGIIHEPWHYRYVGVEAATEIMDRGICLEEYLGAVE